MKKKTLLFFILLFGGALIAVLTPGFILNVQEQQLLQNLRYIPSTHYHFRSDEQGLSLLDRLIASTREDSSIVSLDLEAVSSVYGNREQLIDQINAELEQYYATLFPAFPADQIPQLSQDAYLHFTYILDSATMQGFMYCFAECSFAQGELYLIMDMESKRIVQFELYDTPDFPKIYDYFTLHVTENMADYLSLSLAQSDFTVDTLNMLLGGGGQAGTFVLKDDSAEMVFTFSCWQDGLMFYPGT